MEVFTYEDYLKCCSINKLKEENVRYNTEENNISINKEHDKLIKTILTKEEISKILKRYLNLNISKEELEEWNNKYITKNYRERESDIVYKIKGRNIFFLIEHQSKIDNKMPFRILEYSIEIMREELYRIINYILRPKIGNEETEKMLKKLKEKEEDSMVHEVLEREFRKNYVAGKKEGKTQGKIEIARKMKKRNYSCEIISEITELEIEKIRKI